MRERLPGFDTESETRFPSGTRSRPIGEDPHRLEGSICGFRPSSIGSVGVTGRFPLRRVLSHHHSNGPSRVYLFFVKARLYGCPPFQRSSTGDITWRIRECPTSRGSRWVAAYRGAKHRRRSPTFRKARRRRLRLPPGKDTTARERAQKTVRLSRPSSRPARRPTPARAPLSDRPLLSDPPAGPSHTIPVFLS